MDETIKDLSPGADPVFQNSHQMNRSERRRLLKRMASTPDRRNGEEAENLFSTSYPKAQRCSPPPSPAPWNARHSGQLERSGTAM
jgi:hypothetical protein